MKNSFIFIGLLIFGATATASPDLLKVVAEKLRRRENVSGTFTSRREIKSLDTTLDSSGDFKLSRVEGLEWRQLLPFASTVYMSSSRFEIMRDDQKVQAVSKEENPLVFGMAQTFLSLFSGDMTELNTQFATSISGTEKKWKILLQPKNEIVKKGLRQIEIEGREVIDNLKIADASGNLMTITLKVRPVK